MRYVFAAITLVAIISCNKDENLKVDKLKGVHLVGERMLRAAYWKDSILTILPGGNVSSQANRICISDNNIFIAGTVSDINYIARPVIWKNTVVSPLPLPSKITNTYTCVISDFIIDGGNQYVSGTLYDIDNKVPTMALAWKNGELLNLGDSLNNRANNIIIYNNSVYIGGFTGYWMNGNFNPIANSAYLSTIAISNGDIYAAGRNESWVSGYWKNGESFIALPFADFQDAQVVSIMINNTDVYVLGMLARDSWNAPSGNTSILWKNGIINQIWDESQSGCTSFIQANNQIYVTGALGIGAYKGVYWLISDSVKKVYPKDSDATVINSILVK